MPLIRLGAPKSSIISARHQRGAALRLLHFFREFVAEFLHLGRYHIRTITLVRIVGEVLLVIVFGDVELRCGRDFGDDGIAEGVGRGQLRAV